MSASYHDHRPPERMVERLRRREIDSPEFLDTIYSILASSTRRSTLRELLAHRDPVAVDELAARVAAAEHAVPPESVDRRHRDEVVLALRHVHLPLLVDAGLVTWERRTDAVALKPIVDCISFALPDGDGLLDPSLEFGLGTD